MTRGRRLLLVTTALGATAAWGQAALREPHLGYVYPAGARQGTVVQVSVGGFNLRNTRAVLVNGNGVSGTVGEIYQALRQNQINDAAQHIRELVRQRLAERTGGTVPDDAKKPELPELPDHPWLRGLQEMTLDQLNELRARLYDPKRQPNSQLADTVTVELTIDFDAPPGDRELRLESPAGLTNSLCFQVGKLPEVSEPTTVNSEATDGPPIVPPAVLNGQIMPGDTDRFPIEAKAGQRLVVEVAARRLVPYLADAVPGWFQATLTLDDPQGKELAFVDDYGIDPDPVLLYEVPADGVYRLAVRDSIYRGREDFVYRIIVGEEPFVTGMFPLGGPTGVETLAGLVGWNLPGSAVRLDTQPGGEELRRTILTWPSGRISNDLWYAVDDAPEADEKEPNDDASAAQGVALPRVVNGQIGWPGDVDVFQFRGRAGETVVADVCARRLRSQLDSLLRLSDATGRVLAWNDDVDEQATGLVTHHADSYLRAELPADGTYLVSLTDTRREGGAGYAYRLRLSPPKPDFELRVTPSAINVPAGRGVPVWVHALRKDGFDDDIFLGLVRPPKGFDLIGGWVPHGRNKARVTLVAPARPPAKPVELHLAGAANIGGVEVVHDAVPADDMMQAFANRHLVPAQQLLAAVTRTSGIAATVELPYGQPVRIVEGGRGRVAIKTTQMPSLDDLDLELVEPPKGIRLGEPELVDGGVVLTVESDGEAAKAGLADNLIVEVFRNSTTGGQDGKPLRARRDSLGYLPAIPIQVGPR